MFFGGIRRLTGIAVLVLGGAGVWAVAPAFSTVPYVPEAIDFEQPVGDTVERLPGSGPIRFRTEPIRAPRRFDLVGVAGETGAFEYRTRRDGEPWSGWVETSDGNPVWAGGGDFVQVRSHEQRIEGRLHYVNVTGTDTGANRLLTGLRSAVSSAVVTVLGTDRADAAGSLSYVPRSAWGANRKQGGCPPRVTPVYGSVKRVAIHHTVSTNDYSAELAPAVVLGICRYHRNANGWNDIGYNALIDRFGVLYEGRAGGINRAVVGAHAGDWNSRVSGVALIGNHVAEAPSPETLTKLVKYMAWKMGTHGLTRATGGARMRSDGGPLNRYPEGARPFLPYVLTHRYLNETTCAGGATQALLKRIRRRIQTRIDNWGGSLPQITPTEGRPPAPSGEPPDDGGTGSP